MSGTDEFIHLLSREIKKLEGKSNSTDRRAAGDTGCCNETY